MAFHSDFVRILPVGDKICPQGGQEFRQGERKFIVCNPKINQNPNTGTASVNVQSSSQSSGVSQPVVQAVRTTPALQRLRAQGSVQTTPVVRQAGCKGCHFIRIDRNKSTTNRNPAVTLRQINPR